MNQKTKIAAALLLAGSALAGVAQAAKPVPGLKATLREVGRAFELAPGERTFVTSACNLGEIAIGGSVSSWTPGIEVAMSHLSFDGVRSSWTIEWRNPGTEPVQAYASTSAICTVGTMEVATP